MSHELRIKSHKLRIKRIRKKRTILQHYYCQYCKIDIGGLPYYYLHMRNEHGKLLSFGARSNEDERTSYEKFYEECAEDDMEWKSNNEKEIWIQAHIDRMRNKKPMFPDGGNGDFAKALRNTKFESLKGDINILADCCEGKT